MAWAKFARRKARWMSSTSLGSSSTNNTVDGAIVTMACPLWAARSRTYSPCREWIPRQPGRPSAPCLWPQWPSRCRCRDTFPARAAVQRRGRCDPDVPARSRCRCPPPTRGPDDASGVILRGRAQPIGEVFVQRLREALHGPEGRAKVVGDRVRKGFKFFVCGPQFVSAPLDFFLRPLTLGNLSLQVLIDVNELVRLLPRLLAHLEQVHEHRNFGFQYFRCEGLDEVIHGANGITLEHGQLTLVARGEENNRRVHGPLAFANQRRRLKTIHPRHVHVEQDDSKVLHKHAAKSLRP